MSDERIYIVSAYTGIDPDDQVPLPMSLLLNKRIDKLEIWEKELYDSQDRMEGHTIEYVLTGPEKDATIFVPRDDGGRDTISCRGLTDRQLIDSMHQLMRKVY